MAQIEIQGIWNISLSISSLIIDFSTGVPFFAGDANSNSSSVAL